MRGDDHRKELECPTAKRILPQPPSRRHPPDLPYKRITHERRALEFEVMADRLEQKRLEISGLLSVQELQETEATKRAVSLAEGRGPTVGTPL